MKKSIKFITIGLAVVLILGVYLAISTISDNTSEDKDTNPQETTAAAEVLPRYRVGIIQYDDSRMYQEALTGFEQELSATGLESGENIVVTVENADGSKENCESIAKTFVDNNFDLIYAIGEDCAVTAYEKTKDIPIIFSAVTDPEASGLVSSNEIPDTNVTGVSNYTPCFEQIDLILELYPNAKTVGTIYNETDADSLLQVNIAKKEAEKIGLELNTFSFKDGDDVSQKADEMAQQVEVIYLPTGYSVKNNLEEILDIANLYSIPVIAGDEDMVINGCLATYDIDYYSLGKSAADMAISVLYNGAETKTMPVKYVSQCNLFVNEETAQRLSLSFSQEIQQKMIKI